MLQLQERLRERKVLRKKWNAKSSPKAHHLEIRKCYSPDRQPVNKPLPTQKKRNGDDGRLSKNKPLPSTNGK